MQKRQTEEQLKEEEQIRDRIKRAILSKNIKLKQFARDSGMAYPSLRDYYSGLRKPGFDAIATILRFTGVSAEWLMLGTGSMFTDDDTPLTNVDEFLVGQISKEISQQEGPTGDESELAEDGGDYAYTETDAARRAGARGVIVGSVYNRVANIKAEKRREEAIKREVRQLLRMSRSMNRLEAPADEEADT